MRIRDLARRLAARIRSLPTPAVDAGLAIIFLGAVVTERLRNPLPLGLLSVVAAVLTLALAISLALRRRVPFTAFAISHCGSLHRVATACPERILPAGQSDMRLLGRRVRVSGAGSLGRAGDRCRRSALFCGHART